MSGHWFEDLADHMGPAYLNYSFTRGTANEVAFLTDTLNIQPGDRVLDVGCGPGRHALALAAHGADVVGVDISQKFVDLGNAAEVDGARFFRADARALDFDREFDVVVSLCQGAFGLSGGPSQRVGDPAPPDIAPKSIDVDLPVLSGMARALKPGGRLAFSAFSSYFQVRFLEYGDSFDAATGINREKTSVRNVEGAELETDLWTSCFTPRELRLMCLAAGLPAPVIYSVTPGAYAPNPPSIDQPEFLVVTTKKDTTN